MSDELMEIKDVIGIHSPVCPSCGWSLYYEIRIDSIEAQDAHWDLRGKGIPRTATKTCFCARCGSMFLTTLHMIPIECAPFPCPKCNQLQHLEYKIQRIQVEHDSFQFEATITCKKCGNAKSFKEVLKKILGVLKITVGPTGITVSKN